jgi:hypothetical protein
MLKYLMGFFLTLHAAIHWVGVSLRWRMAEYQRLANDPWFDMPTWLEKVWGGIWLAALVLLAAAGIAVAVGRRWWRAVAIVGVVVSTIAIVPYFPGAGLGLVANLIVVGVLIGTDQGVLDLPGSPVPAGG